MRILRPLIMGVFAAVLLNAVPGLGAGNDAVLAVGDNLVWNSFLGGTGTDDGSGVTLDGSGNAFVTGYSLASWGSPLRSFSVPFDAFVAKLDAGGNLVWHTFLGGNGSEFGYAIAVDSSGNIYVTGSGQGTWGSPLRAYTFYDGFVAKLDANGNLLWNTFLGGSEVDVGQSIAVDGSGNVYVTGYSDGTWGSPLRAFSGLHNRDVFVAKLGSSGTLQWHTFLGSGNSFGSDIVVDGNGNPCISGSSGQTWGSPLRSHSGGDDAFLAKLDANGSLLWNTFLGGGNEDDCNGLALDDSGNFTITGWSFQSWGSPLRPYTLSYDAFVAKLDASGNLLWNTFLGSNSVDKGEGITIDHYGNAYVAGTSGATWGNPLRASSGGNDAFVAKLDASGNLQWNTFLGGGGSDQGYGVAADGDGNSRVVGTSAVTWGSPVRAFTGSGDAFVAKLGADGTPPPPPPPPPYALPEWNTSLGSGSTDSGYGVAVDTGGKTYVTGFSGATWGSPRRVFTGGGDAFVAKLDSDGDVLWNTFLGGSGFDDGRGIAVDGAGNVYVTGESAATWGSPLRAFAGGTEVFAAKLDADGHLLWLTFLGGSGVDGTPRIAVDGLGSAYVSGRSAGAWASPLRAHSGGLDAFAAKLDPGGNLAWNTFLGGAAADQGSGIAVDGSGDAYVTGSSGGTWGSPLRAHAGGDDAFVTKLAASGNLLWHTFLGGGNADLGAFIAVDSDGNSTSVGYSGATWGNPRRAYSAGPDAFVARLDAGGILQWSTFLGGGGSDFGYGLALDHSGDIRITGESGATWGNPLRPHPGGQSGFVAKVSAGGYLLWNTFLGGGCMAIAVDQNRAAFVIGHLPAPLGRPDAFVAKLDADYGSPSGDCNADLAADAADLSALVLEIFDGDGTVPTAAYQGSFPGSTRCDANADDTIDAGDISCLGLLLLNGPSACTE